MSSAAAVPEQASSTGVSPPGRASSNVHSSKAWESSLRDSSTPLRRRPQQRALLPAPASLDSSSETAAVAHTQPGALQEPRTYAPRQQPTSAQSSSFLSGRGSPPERLYEVRPLSPATAYSPPLRSDVYRRGSLKHDPHSPSDSNAPRHYAADPIRRGMDSSFASSHVSSARPMGSAILRLTEELESVRRAWRSEGTDLRERVLELHASKVQAEETVMAMEEDMRAREEELQRRMADMERDLRAAHADMDAARKVSADSEAHHNANAARLRAEVDEMIRKFSEAMVRERGLAAEKAQLAAELAATQEHVRNARAEADAYRRERDEATHQISRLNQELSSQRLALAEAQANASARQTALETTVAAMRAQIDVIQREADAAIGAARTSVADTQRHAEAAADIAARREDALLSEATARTNDLVAQLQASEKERNELKLEVAALRAMINAAEQEFATVADAASALMDVNDSAVQRLARDVARLSGSSPPGASARARLRESHTRSGASSASRGRASSSGVPDTADVQALLAAVTEQIEEATHAASRATATASPAARVRFTS